MKPNFSYSSGSSVDCWKVWGNRSIKVPSTYSASTEPPALIQTPGGELPNQQPALEMLDHAVTVYLFVFLCVYNLQLQKALGEKQTDGRELVQEALGSHNPGGTNVCIDRCNSSHQGATELCIEAVKSLFKFPNDACKNSILIHNLAISS